MTASSGTGAEISVPGLEMVREALRRGEPERAQDLASRWIERHPLHPRLAEAYLLRGHAKVAQGNLYQALYDYEYIARSFPGSEQFHAALQRELEIAQRFAHGYDRKFLGLRILPAGNIAEELLIRIQERAPGSELAERAGLALADYYYRQEKMELAAQAYGLFLEMYPRSQWRQYVMLRRIMANLAAFKGLQYDVTDLRSAHSRMEQYENAYPAAAEKAGVDAVQRRIEHLLAKHALSVAGWYLEHGEAVSARFLYKRVIQTYPSTSAADKALNRLRAMTGGTNFARATDATEAVSPKGKQPRSSASSQATTQSSSHKP